MAENQPLLAPNDNQDVPPSYSEVDESSPHDPSRPTAIGEYELPPPYTPSAHTPLTHVNCKVCCAPISLEGRHHLYVVKCSVCNEATPVKNAPPGKKYVRCPCNCLLMCSVGAVRIACPRDNCRRMISLQSPAVHFASAGAVLGHTVRARCAHCGQNFVFLKRNTKHKLAICPHCSNRSAVGNEFIKRRVILFVAIGIFFMLLGVATTVVSVATTGGVGVYVVWIGAYITGALMLLRAAVYGCVKISPVIN